MLHAAIVAAIHHSVPALRPAFIRSAFRILGIFEISEAVG